MPKSFEQEVSESIELQGKNDTLSSAASTFLTESIASRYSYNFTWLGRPIIQYPQDIVGFQEIVFAVKPDLIIETGVAHGGSLILSASLLAMLDLQDQNNLNKLVKRRVIGIDIDIRQHNRIAIENHFLSRYIQLVEGSSVDPEIVSKVSAEASQYKNVLVCLDSNHTHDHVLAELVAYSPFVSLNSYCIVFDTVIESLPANTYNDRPWCVGNNPMSAIRAFISESSAFEIDTTIDSKLLISVAPNGYLKRVSP
jgi:cephalosporin hydroxylase